MNLAFGPWWEAVARPYRALYGYPYADLGEAHLQRMTRAVALSIAKGLGWRSARRHDAHLRRAGGTRHRDLRRYAEMPEDPADDGRPLDERDQTQAAAAPVARQHVKPEGTGHQRPNTGRGRVAPRRLGADEVVVSGNADEMQKHAGSFDFILDAVSADHDVNAYLNLLAHDGTLAIVGAPEKPLASRAGPYVCRNT